MRIEEQHGPLHMAIDLPDELEEMGLRLTVHLSPQTETELDQVIHAFGGVSAFAPIDPRYSFLRGGGERIGLWVDVPEEIASGGTARYPGMEALRGLQQQVEAEQV